MKKKHKEKKETNDIQLECFQTEKTHRRQDTQANQQARTNERLTIHKSEVIFFNTQKIHKYT